MKFKLKQQHTILSIAFLIVLVAGHSHAQENSKAADEVVSQFAEDVLFHVVMHELGHGLVREFDLPILGNEETLADTFATHYIVSRLPSERALQILKARVNSLMFEAREVPRDEWTVKGEHNSDARRLLPHHKRSSKRSGTSTLSIMSRANRPCCTSTYTWSTKSPARKRSKDCESPAEKSVAPI